MAKQAHLDDGTVLEFPDDTPDSVVDSVVKSHMKPEPTKEEKTRSHFLSRLGFGAMEPMIGAGQLLAHGIDAATGSNLSDSVDSYWQGEKQKQEDANKSTGVGTDYAGFAGNLLSPVNALLAAKALPIAATIGGKVAQSAGLGAAGALMQPVYDGDYATSKAVQGVAGATGGAVLGGIAGKFGDLAARQIEKPTVKALTNESSQTVNDAVAKALAELNLNTGSVPQETIDNLRRQVITGLENNKSIDAAAALRKADFDALDIQPLQGQITRDPLQFAQERNMRGAVPEIAQVMETQGKRLRDKLSTNADESYTAGDKIVNALMEFDKTKQSNVSALYRQARESSGKDLNIPLQGLSTDYANILDKYQEKIPGGVKKKFEDLGLLSGKQMKTFNVEDADQLLKLINDHVGSDKATNNALSELRSAVKNSVNSVDASGGVFAPAVNAAKERFRLHDELPALKKVADGGAINDSFINKYVINGDTKSVNKMADILRESNPDAFAVMRDQIAKTLEKAAYGENMAGDAPLAPERLAKTLNKFGTEKLKAVFSQEEVDNLNRIARVGAYINKVPDVAPVNSSNTYVSMAMNNLPGKSKTSAVVSAIAGNIKREMAASKSLNANVPFKNAPLTKEQAEIAANILKASGITGGVVGGMGTR